MVYNKKFSLSKTIGVSTLIRSHHVLNINVPYHQNDTASNGVVILLLKRHSIAKFRMVLYDPLAIIPASGPKIV